MSNCNTYKTDDQPWNRIDNTITFNRPWARVENICSDTTKPTLASKHNSARLTKRQLYAQIAKGYGPYRKKSWASQSMNFPTNPNTHNLQEIGTTLKCPTTSN